MSVYVADASVAVKWYVPEIHSDDALRLLEPGNELHVPDLMHVEVGRILWKKSRCGEITSGEARRIAKALLAAPWSVHATAVLLGGALDIALRTSRTVYDGIHVALAVALGAPLVTADRHLANALERSAFARHLLWVEEIPEAG